jgi:integrase
MAYLEDRWAVSPARGRNGLRWRVRWRDPQQRLRSRSFTHKAEAERWLHHVQNELNAGTYASPDRAKVTVGHMAEQWAHAHLPTLKPSTASGYEGVLRLLVLPRWGSVPLAAVAYGDVAAWVGDLTSVGTSASRVRHAYGLLCQVLDLAVADRRLPANPARGVRLPRLPLRPRHRYLGHTELLRLAMACGDARQLVLVLGYTGLRWGEAVALTGNDWDAVHSRLHIDHTLTEVGGKLVAGTPKTHQRRTVPVPGYVAQHLHADAGALLLPTPAGGVWRSTNFRRRIWLPALAALGYEHMRPHDLRHTAASLAVQSGANVLAVARMLGHRDPSITLRVYADLFDSDLDDVAARLHSAAQRAADGLAGQP